MTILIDEPRTYGDAPPGAAKWSHMVSDSSLDELHEFAAKLNLQPRWFQQHGRVPHYDITQAKWRKAQKLGATVVPYTEIVRRAVRA